MPPPGRNVTLSILSSDSIAAFLCRKEAQRKAIKRNAEKERGLFEKSPLSIPEKLLGNWCRVFGECIQGNA